MTKHIETGLSISPKMGAALIEQAIQSNRKAMQDRVVTTIGQLLKQVEKQRKALDRLERMIDACQKGLFNLNENGQIAFLDEELNSDALWISPCAQCGYDKFVTAPHRGAR